MISEKGLLITKENLVLFIEQIINNYKVFAPINKDGIVKFDIIKSPEEIKIHYTNTTIPPKCILFPQTEKIFNFKIEKQKINLYTTYKPQKTIVFGMRPCDANSSLILDKIFLSTYTDTYYNEKRKNTIIIGLSCTEPEIECFCTSFDGISPVSTNGVDIMLTDMGKKYYVQLITEKCNELINLYKKLFLIPSETDIANVKKIQKCAEEKIKIKYDVTKPLQNLYTDKLFDEIGMKCLGCSICTYLCPTCHCFDIQDELLHTKGNRVRIWDSCMFPEYTLQASGENPRPTRKDRIKNRIYHKYKWYMENFNVHGCVGCGRCVKYCPVNIDIRNIIEKIMILK